MDGNNDERLLEDGLSTTIPVAEPFEPTNFKTEGMYKHLVKQ